MLIETLKTILLVCSLVAGILLVLILIYALIKTPFDIKRKEKAEETALFEVAKAIEDLVIKEIKEEKTNKKTRTKKSYTFDKEKKE